MATKLTDCSSKKRLLQAREELDELQDKCKQDRNLKLDHVHMDFPDAQYEKAFYLKKIEEFLTSNKTNKGKA